MTLNYSKEELVEMAGAPHFNGFTADTCHSCHKTANVLCGQPGWFCVCGEFQPLCHHSNTIPHEAPDYGPSRTEIHEAVRVARSK